MPVVKDIHGEMRGNYVAFNSTKVLWLRCLLTDSIQEATTSITVMSISSAETDRDVMYTNKRAFRCSHVAGAAPIDPDTVGLRWATGPLDPATEGYKATVNLRDPDSGAMTRKSGGSVWQYLVWKTCTK